MSDDELIVHVEAKLMRIIDPTLRYLPVDEIDALLKSELPRVLALAKIGAEAIRLRDEPYTGGDVMGAWDELEAIVDQYRDTSDAARDDGSGADGGAE
jgi:hypothetical protein